MFSQGINQARCLSIVLFFSAHLHSRSGDLSNIMILHVAAESGLVLQEPWRRVVRSAPASASHRVEVTALRAAGGQGYCVEFSSMKHLLEEM